jgi:hypothetical protein
MPLYPSKCCELGSASRLLLLPLSFIWTHIWVLQGVGSASQKEVTTLEETRFSFDCLCKNKAQSLFGFQSSNSSNSHVPIVNYHNPMRLADASCWPTTHGGKKVRWPSMFKITQQHMNNWEDGRLFL